MAAPQDFSPSVDEQVRALIAANDVGAAVTLAVRALGPEVMGFLAAVIHSHADADEAFAATCEQLWRSLATFEWRCSLRTWTYVIARREAARVRKNSVKRMRGQVHISELAEVIAHVRTETQPALRSSKRAAVTRLRDELPPEDRELLVLRVDRNLEWEDIALAFEEEPENATEEARKREAARLRKRFQLVKKRLAERAREEGLIPPKGE